MDFSAFERCTGCAACANACPARAITMRENEIGYYHPVVDTERCTKCGLCEVICPEMAKRQGNEVQKCFAVQADDDLRYVSSSGGAFSLIVEEWFNLHKGKEIYVAGAAFDSSWDVHHILINDLRDLDSLRRSKYVQSFIGEDFFRTIKERLQKGAFVIFSGVPCQAAGLRSFLRKDYDNLLIIDLLCGKCPSPKVYRKFLEDNSGGKTVTCVKFRSKNKGWLCGARHTIIATENSPEVPHNLWMQGFWNNLMLKESCAHCQYRSLNRQADITIGDFWGIGKSFPHLDDSKGTSLVLTDTVKGEEVVQSFKARCKIHEELDIEEAIKSNSWSLKQCEIIPHKNIDIFNAYIDELGYNKCLSRVMNKAYDVAVSGWFWAKNCGSILTYYALQETLKELGYHPKIINYIPKRYKDGYYGGHTDKVFSKKYFRLTKEINNYRDFKLLNDEFCNFVVGSDQQWLWYFFESTREYVFFNFVNSKNKKISYATSFGAHSSYDGPDNQRRLRKLWLSRFDAISVREHEGVAVLKNDFGVEGTQVLDAVFLIDKSYYEKIANDSFQTGNDFISYYFVRPTEAKMCIVKDAEKYYNRPSVKIPGYTDLVEDFLYSIINCKMLITDSFHGTCFATIFNKNFISISPFINQQPYRFTTLFSVTGMKDRFLVDPSEFNKRREYLFQDIDWSKANANLQKEIARSRAWLQNALEKSPREPSEDVELINTILGDTEEKMLAINEQLEGMQVMLEKLLHKTASLSAKRVSSAFKMRSLSAKINTLFHDNNDN